MFAKMKKMTACALAACALCLALAPGIAWAGEAPGVVLDPGDGSEGSGQNPGENSGEGTGGSNAKPSPEKLPSGTNVSPGAPSGSDKALVTTGDGLFPLVAGCVAVALVAGAVVLVVALRSRRR